MKLQVELEKVNQLPEGSKQFWSDILTYKLFIYILKNYSIKNIFKFKKFIYSTVFIFLLINLFSGCSSSRQEIENRTSGSTQATGTGSTEREALENAKIQAIKNIIREQIKGSTSVIDGQLQNSSVSSFFKGFVSQVKLINKSQKNGLYEVTIECFVDTKEVNNYIENVLISKSKPRFMVLVSENNLGQALTPEMSQQSSTETTLISTLNDLGFDFVQKNEPILNLLKAQKGNLNLALQGNAKAAKELGIETGAELVIIGNSKMEDKGAAGTGGRRTVHAISSLKIIDVGTGSIIASQETYGGDASTNPEIASMNAIKYAIDEALNGTTDRVGLLRQMLKKWNPGNGNEIQIGLEVNDFEELSEFITILEKADERVVSVESKGFKPGKSVVQVFFRGTSTDLLKIITKNKEMKEKFPKLTVLQQSASQILMRMN